LTGFCRFVPAFVLAVALCAGGFAAPGAEAAGPLSPVDNWVKLDPAQGPPANYAAASAYDESNGEVVRFGGANGSALSSETWTWDGTTWTQRFPAHSPTARRDAVMAFDPASGEVLLFGGGTLSSYFNDTWAWDGNDWTQLSPAQSPPARILPSLTFDQASGEMLLFGGANGSGFLGDTWTWRDGDWHQESPAHHPSNRDGSNLAFDPSEGRPLLFGGWTGSYLNDTWTWDGQDWIQESPAHSPPVRGFSSMDYDPALGEMVLFGGRSVVLDDTWAWDAGDWTELNPATRPDPRRFAALTFDPSMGKLMMTGGLGNSSTLTDTWTYGPPDGVEPNWRQLEPSANPPVGLGASMAFDPSSGETVLFGYDNGAGAGTWTWDGSDWTDEAPAHSPSARTDSAMAFDQATGEIVLFGGVDDAILNDTWTWDGTDWTQEAPATSPPPMLDSAMAFDPATGQMVLFGGSTGAARSDQTWVWDGSTWTQRFPAHSPSARSATSMAFDPATGEMLLFGGSGNGYKSDTWTWDGSDWTERDPADQPPARFEAELEFDPSIASPVLFSGFNGSGSLHDTWRWTGDNWVQLNPADNPQLQAEAPMSYDPASGEMVLVGKSTSGPSFQTWVFDLEVGPPSAEVASPADGRSFTVGETVATAFSCEESPGGPGVATCEDSNGDSAPAGSLDTSSLGPHSYAVTATSEDGLTGTDEINYAVEQAEPAIAGSGAAPDVEIGASLGLIATLAEGYQPTGEIVFRLFGPDDETCSGTPAFESDPVAVTGNGEYESPAFAPIGPGTYRWVMSYSGDGNNEAAASACGGDGTVSIVGKAQPSIAADSATDARLGAAISVKANLSSGHAATGTIVFRAYRPADACSGVPAYESAPVPVNGDGTYSAPEITPADPGSYHWTATYSGDADNDAAGSACGEPGSISTVSSPPRPGYKCPAARPGLTLATFGLKAPYGNAKPVIGVRAIFRSKNAVVKIKPSMTYRLAGKMRTVRLKARILKVNGSRELRFRAPDRLKSDFRRIGRSPRRAPVTFRVEAWTRVQGSRAKCFRGIGARTLRMRLGNVSSRVALRRLNP